MSGGSDNDRAMHLVDSSASADISLSSVPKLHQTRDLLFVSYLESEIKIENDWIA